MKTHVFLITAKTNLHVGDESGGEFSIIDKSVQRNPLTGLPCINSSSLKGSIKEYCVHENKKLASDKRIPVKKLFGSDVDPNGKVLPETEKGRAVFFDAELLYLPQQDKDQLFHYETTADIVEMMNKRVQLFDRLFNYTVKQSIDGKSVNVLTDNGQTSASKQFEARCSNDNLPIIARNALENGESKNLWYEQVLPAETVLYTIIREEGDDLKDALDKKIVQIGAKATIGYGYCRFECISTKED